MIVTMAGSAMLVTVAKRRDIETTTGGHCHALSANKEGRRDVRCEM